MKIFLLVVLLATTATAQFGGFGNFGNRVNNAAGNLLNTVSDRVQQLRKSVPAIGEVRDFGDFLTEAGKNYADAAERTLREGVFKARQTLVDANKAAFSAGQVPYELALNAFSDLTDAEFFKFLTGNKRNPQGDAKANEFRKESSDVGVKNKLPDSFDWRAKGGVSEVKYQGECGSCWSFATTGAIEGHVFRKTGKLPNLSEQNLVDCGREEFGLLGCDGGFQEYGFSHVSEQKGIAGENTYPYTEMKDKCKYTASMRAAEIQGFSSIRNGDEKTMKAVIALKGPLACSMKAVPSFLQYKRGLFADPECKPQNDEDLNHSVLVVGYGTEQGKDYWIVKNTYDKVWGEEGYFRLPRGENACGIAIECSYPVV